MFSFSVQVPSIWPRRLRKSELVPLSFQTAQDLKAHQRSRSIDAYPPIRRKPVPPPILYEVPSPILPSVHEANLVSVAPAVPVKEYHSLPARLRYDLVEVVPRRGRLPREEEFYRPETSRGRSELRTILAPRRSSSRARSTLVSYSPTRRLVIEESATRRPRSLSHSSRQSRNGRQSRHSTHSRSKSSYAAPILHYESSRAIEYEPVRTSRRSGSSRTPSPAPSRLTDTSLHIGTSPATSASSDFGSPRSRVASKGPPCSLSPDHGGTAPLFPVSEQPLTPKKSSSDAGRSIDSTNAASAKTTTTTQYRYRYTPVEDDNASIKSFVRSIEQAGHARAKQHRRTTSLPPPVSPGAISGASRSLRSPFSNDQSGRLPRHTRTQSASQSPSYSSSHAEVARGRPASASAASSHRAPSVAHSSKSARFTSTSAPIVPSMRADSTADTVALTTEKIAPSGPSSTGSESSKTCTASSAEHPSSSGRPSAKFRERFSVCLDPETTFGDDGTSSVVMPTKEKNASRDEDRRSRRMRRVLKMAEYAAGRR